MLLLAVVAFFATGSFFKLARKCGSHPGRAASTPIIGLAAVLLANHIASTLFAMAFDRLEVVDSTQSMILFSYNLIIVFAYLVFLRKNADSILNRHAEEST